MNEYNANKSAWNVIVRLSVVGIFSLPVCAQTVEVKEKPPLYTYTENWNIPRARWTEMGKKDVTYGTILDKAVAAGTLISYGDDANVIHLAEEFTHDRWWSAMSISALMNVLDEINKSVKPSPPTLDSNTKRWDSVYVSRFYNWRSGSWNDVYTHGSSYTLKPGVAKDSVQILSKYVIGPALEKLFIDGTLREYDIDIEAIHTETPGTFWVFYVVASAEGIDKTEATLNEAFRANPLAELAVGSIVDFTAHRDFLAHTNAKYK